MTRIFILIFFLLNIHVFSFAQSASKFELRGGVGFATAPEILEDITGGITQSIVNPGFTKVDLSGTVAAMITILLKPESRFSYGLDLVYDNIKSNYIYADPAQNTRTNTGYLSIMARGDFKYVRKPSFSIYSSLAAGITLRNADVLEEGSDIKTDDLGGAFHVSPIGIRYGNKLAVWAEAGFGFKGVLCGGVAVRF